MLEFPYFQLIDVSQYNDDSTLDYIGEMWLELYRDNDLLD